VRDVLSGDPAGLARAVSIVVALGVTAAGYAYGRLVSGERAG
jgi:hypothetical protein